MFNISSTPKRPTNQFNVTYLTKTHRVPNRLASLLVDFDDGYGVHAGEDTRYETDGSWCAVRIRWNNND